MTRYASMLAVILGLFAASEASPRKPSGQEHSIVSRSLSCNSLTFGLSAEHCAWMSAIGMAGQGVNAYTNNGGIWIGSDGPNTFTFMNDATTTAASLILLVWAQPAGDYQASFMNVRAPAISYSLPNAGDSVTISIANGVAGAWSALEDFATALSSYGQVFNTWGEFSTGNSATVDVSREANMAGSFMVLRVANNGCTADMGTCVYACTGGANSCGAADTYGLFNCATGSQAGANQYMVNGNPTGGCQGWSNGGHVDVWLMS